MITIHDLRHTDPAVAEAWLDHIAEHLRPTDIEEIAAMSGVSPHEAIRVSAEISSHCFVATDRHNNPCVVFGAAPHPLPGVGVVWMVGTPGIDREAIGIARASRPAFDLLNEAYPIALWNFIDDRNHLSRRWLAWGGFREIGKQPMGPEGLPFTIFARTAANVRT
jgi:hypothetical protein